MICESCYTNVLNEEYENEVVAKEETGRNVRKSPLGLSFAVGIVVFFILLFVGIIVFPAGSPTIGIWFLALMGPLGFFDFGGVCLFAKFLEG